MHKPHDFCLCTLCQYAVPAEALKRPWTWWVCTQLHLHFSCCWKYLSFSGMFSTVHKQRAQQIWCDHMKCNNDTWIPQEFTSAHLQVCLCPRSCSQSGLDAYCSPVIQARCKHEWYILCTHYMTPYHMYTSETGSRLANRMEVNGMSLSTMQLRHGDPHPIPSGMTRTSENPLKPDFRILPVCWTAWTSTSCCSCAPACCTNSLNDANVRTQRSQVPSAQAGIH